jgi:F-type H+-transporting ATPase subunit gamma
METLESLRTKIDGAQDLKSVVRSMKAMAAANISQYELAVASLGEYSHTVALGIVAYFRVQNIQKIEAKKMSLQKAEEKICAIVFGSDQGLVGQFNNSLADFVVTSLHALPGKKEIWVVGERIQSLLADAGFPSSKLFAMPGSIDAITPMVGQLLVQSEENYDMKNINEFYVFHNKPNSGSGYEAVSQRFLPLDEKWRKGLTELRWPTKNLPQVAGSLQPTLLALVHEFLFVSLFRACAESLAGENESRLQAMQRAEKNIGDLLDDLGNSYHRLRQSSIDEELFDVVSGFESLKKTGKRNK